MVGEKTEHVLSERPLCLLGTAFPWADMSPLEAEYIARFFPGGPLLSERVDAIVSAILRRNGRSDNISLRTSS